MTTTTHQDHADVERVFGIYVQSITAADVVLASQVWLQSPDVLIVTPFGRYQGWDAVKDDIYPAARSAFPERLLQASNVSLVVSGDVAWLVYDFVFSGTRTDGKPFRFAGWESHGYQRTPEGWRIAHLHYSLPAPNPEGDTA